ncbi:ribosome small subunit-dependent GTPase A [Geovibrio thiophilus]|uniref:Small ribosomal subunit biogenesis GTPase RsgA n=1 Tax=Geovibrio thiophilus TaxID=139438 RepID=A0A410JUG8_9BACT|nr:ribosome small subunit-dependent GTPase A [Geovibrio thiophilus]QAR31857.1 ribosome small subunit-dependent GTPase A [Geovibrio thiophilus]
MSGIGLKKYGLNERLTEEAAEYEGMFIARVSGQHHNLYKVITEKGEIQAVVTGRFRHEAEDGADFPAVGDWVMTDRTEGGKGDAVIHGILPRRSLFVRQAAGTAGGVQVIAANVDTVFICMALNADFNLRRLERYLAAAWESRAKPVVVLTKADLCADLVEKLEETESVSGGAEIVICSSVEENGWQTVRKYIAEGETVAFIGSSGVGKSTLINRLAGRDVLAVNETRAGDDKGRHTTTSRQMILLPDGGTVIDTPGMRELHLYAADLGKTFEDIEQLAANCRFRDCTHTKEPGCAVRTAAEKGELSEDRLAGYFKLRREMTYDGLNSRQAEQEKIKRMFGSKGEMKQLKKYVKNKRK